MVVRLWLPLYLCLCISLAINLTHDDLAYPWYAGQKPHLLSHMRRLQQ